MTVNSEPRMKLLTMTIRTTREPEAEIKVVDGGFASPRCSYCLEPAPLPPRCHRCSRGYCHGRRLPEEHTCPDSKAPQSAVREGVRRKKDKKKERVVVAVDIPWG
ncbi:MAG: hypothetical protein V1915_02200 [Candidatus Bathyarchaeota archaeon]